MRDDSVRLSIARRSAALRIRAEMLQSSRKPSAALNERIGRILRDCAQAEAEGVSAPRLALHVLSTASAMLDALEATPSEPTPVRLIRS